MPRNIAVVRRRNQREAAAPPARAAAASPDRQPVLTPLHDASQAAEADVRARRLYRGADLSWAPTLSTIFKVFVSLRMSAGVWSPIADCDEVYNYWEPLHLLLYGTGFQTWEYSPAYAIRSYAYVWLHALPAKLFQLVLPNTKVTTFFFIRCFLGFASAIADLYLYRAVCRRFGNGVGRLFAVFTAFASGSFVACCAFLPSSFSLTLTTFALAAWLDGRDSAAIVAVAVSALLGWPFAALLGAPVVADMLQRRRVGRFVAWATAAGATVCAAMYAVDSHYFGKGVLAPLNIVIYNVFSAHGPSLYGTAPASFYALNLLLNWNVALPLAIAALPVTAAAVHSSGGLSCTRFLPVVYVQATLLAWLAVFFAQPHKEERFLFPAYSLIAVSAALCVDAAHRLSTAFLPRIKSQTNALVVALLVVFTGASLSRSVALYQNYHAPADVFMALNEQLAAHSNATSASGQLNVCLGKEWYRFPSSFFVPTRSGERPVAVQFVRSEFRGQLPKPFADLPLPQATRVIPEATNDRNLEEASRYVPVDDCHFLVDLQTAETTELEPDYSAMSARWQLVHSERFLLQHASPRWLRAFYVPGLSHSHCVFASYNLLRRIV